MREGVLHGRSGDVPVVKKEVLCVLLLLFFIVTVVGCTDAPWLSYQRLGST